MRRSIVALGVLLGIAAAAPAAAEDVAAAEALFRRGLDAMAAGHYPEACAALAESHRLDPRLGALFTLAECRSKEGKVATAVALYDDYLSAFAALSPADQARQRGRERIAGDKKRALGPRVPRLVLRLPPGVTARVTRDDVTLRPPALGIPLPVDPGEHQVTIQVGRGAVHHQTITIGADEEKVVDLEVAPPAVAPPPAAPPAARPPVAEAPAAQAPSAEPPPAPAGSRRPWAFATLGLGAAGLVVGAATGGVVLARRSVVNADCVNGVCSPAGLDAAASGKTLGGVSTGSFVVGGASLVVAGILFLTDRPAADPAPRASAWRAWRPIVGSVDRRGAFVGAGKEW